MGHAVQNCMAGMHVCTHKGMAYRHCIYHLNHIPS